MGACCSADNGLQAKIQIIEGTVLKAILDAEDQARLAAVCTLARHSADAVIFRQGDYGQSMYLIGQGEVAVSVRDNDQSHALITKDAGDVMCLGGLRGETRRCATGTAVGEVVLVCLEPKHWKTFLSKFAKPKRKVVKALVTLVDSLPTAIRSIPTLSALPPTDRSLLEFFFKPQTLVLEEKVFDNYQLGRELFVVAHGSVTATIDDHLSGATVTKDFLPGDCFGESALYLRDQPRSGSVVARVASRLWRLDMGDLDAFLALRPKFAAALKEVARQDHVRQVTSLLDTLPPFKALSDQFEQLSGLFTRRVLAGGETLVRQDQETQGMFIVHFGSLSMVKDGEGEIAVLKAGKNFGTHALVNQEPQKCSAIGKAPQSVVFSLAREDFVRFHQERPVEYAKFAIKTTREKVPLKEVMMHPEAVVLFEEHLEDEYSGQYLHFWNDAVAFSKETDEAKLKELADIMIEKYVDPNAEDQVNMPAPVRGRIVKGVKHDKFDNTLFAEALKCVSEAMEQDCFSRFKESEPFTELLTHLAT